MGCDIHLYTEYLKDGKWQAADAWQPDTKYHESTRRIPYHLRPYTDRHYDFFGWLADVRNGTWGDPLPVIMEPKGMPDDCCEEIAHEAEQWAGDGHSHGWVTLAELEKAWKETKGEKIKFNGAMSNPDPLWVATPEEQRTAPKSYCASGQGPDGPFKHYVWYQTVEDIIEHPYEKLRSYLWDVTFEFGCSRENVRAVFWFDN